MRFGLAATMAVLALTSCPPAADFAGIGMSAGRDPLPSAANRPARGGGMNAHQLARLAAKNSRRKRRR